jgi:hypothetical protein
MYLGLKVGKSRAKLLEPVIFFTRRAALALIVVMQRNLLVQYFVLQLTIFLQVLYMDYIYPYESKFTHRNQILNEYVLLSVFYTFLCFSDLVADPVAKYEMGFVPCILVSLHLGVNMTILIVGTILKLFRSLKRKVVHKYLRFKKSLNKSEPQAGQKTSESGKKITSNLTFTEPSQLKVN